MTVSVDGGRIDIYITIVREKFTVSSLIYNQDIRISDVTSKQYYYNSNWKVG